MARRGVLDRPEDLLERLVEVLVAFGAREDVLEEHGRRDVVATRVDDGLACHLGVGVGHARIVGVWIALAALPVVDPALEVLGYVAVEQRDEDVLLEVPCVDRVTHVVGYTPYRLVQLGPLLVACHVCHSAYSNRTGIHPHMEKYYIDWT